MKASLHEIKKTLSLIFVLQFMMFVSCNNNFDQNSQSEKTFARDPSAVDGQLQLTEDSALSQSDRDEKERLINEIFQLRAEIAQRMPILESEQDRLYKLTNELTSDNTYGCKFNEKIDSMRILIDGSVDSLSSMGTFDDYLVEPKGGSCTALEFRFGSFTVTVDPASSILGSGTHYEIDRKFTETIGALDYIEVRKIGICYNQERTCRQKFFVSEECKYNVSEENVFYINGINIEVNGRPVYDKNGLNWKFNRNRQVWVDDNFRANEKWVQLMLDNNCKKVQ